MIDYLDNWTVVDYERKLGVKKFHFSVIYRIAYRNALKNTPQPSVKPWKAELDFDIL